MRNNIETWGRARMDKHIDSSSVRQYQQNFRIIFVHVLSVRHTPILAVRSPDYPCDGKFYF